MLVSIGVGGHGQPGNKIWKMAGENNIFHMHEIKKVEKETHFEIQNDLHIALFSAKNWPESRKCKIITGYMFSDHVPL